MTTRCVGQIRSYPRCACVHLAKKPKSQMPFWPPCGQQALILSAFVITRLLQFASFTRKYAAWSHLPRDAKSGATVIDQLIVTHPLLIGGQVCALHKKWCKGGYDEGSRCDLDPDGHTRNARVELFGRKVLVRQVTCLPIPDPLQGGRPNAGNLDLIRRAILPEAVTIAVATGANGAAGVPRWVLDSERLKPACVVPVSASALCGTRERRLPCSLWSQELTPPSLALNFVLGVCFVH